MPRRAAGADARRAGRHRARHHACGLAAPRASSICRRSICIGDPQCPGARARKLLGLDVPIADGRRRRRGRARSPRALPVVPLGSAGRPPSPGSPTPPARPRRSPRSTAPSPTCWPARAAPSSPIRSPRTCSTSAGFADPGPHRISRQARREATGKPVQPVMMLWSPELAVVPVTIHVPLKEVPQR